MRKHRGLSAVIGTVFLVAVVVSSLSYVTYSMNTLGNFSESLITEEKRQKDKQNEEFEITSVSITSQNKLDGVVKNTGQIPLEVKSMWIEEVGRPESIKKFNVSATVAPGDELNLINRVNFDMDTTKGYTMKIISGRGDIRYFDVNSPSSQNLLLNIHVIPEYVPSEFATTVLFTVVNNSSNNNVLYNLTPLIEVRPIGSLTVDLLSGPEPSSYPSLGPGEIATFQYVYKLTGSEDEGAIFNATIVNAVQDNYVETTGLIKTVTLASQSGTALEALGLSTELSADDQVLFFHDETDLTIGGGYQMDGSDPAGTGTTANPKTNAMAFWSQEFTTPLTVYSGKWNASLAYYSKLVPDTITPPSFAFMFECDDCGSSGRTAESTGNISADGFDDQGGPTWHSTGGPDDDGYFSYDGNDYHDADWNVENDYTAHSNILTYKTSTSVWFRTPPTADNFMPIIRWGDEDEGGAGGEDDEYQIALGDGTAGNNGKIVFHYATNFDADATTCLSSGATVYDDNNWHHVLAVRPVDDQCKLYIDGALSTSASCSTCGGSSEIYVDNDDIFIGYDGAGQYFTGDVASFMHWNNVDVSANAYDLSRTNYGTNGTRAHFTIQRTSSTGTILETILENSLFSLNFHDPTQNSDSSNRYNLATSNSTYEKYSFYNFTGTTVSYSTFAATERLKFNISWDSNVQNLPINIRFDDENTSFVMPLDSSYVQTPRTSSDWPSYVNFDRDDKVIYYAYNSGPSGAWFNYQGTRFVATTLDASQSYGALVFAVNGTGGSSNISADKDSVFIPAGKYAAIEFYQLANPPQISPPAGVRIPVGTYNAAIFLSGYDESGEAFLRTIDLGTVTVYDQ